MEKNYSFTRNFHIKKRKLYCEELSLAEVQQQVESQLGEESGPVVVFSKKQILDNVRSYKDPLDSSGMQYILGYAMKAFHNPHVLELLQQQGCGVVTVSGNEIRAALQAGVEPGKIIYNGNGKLGWELRLALSHHCLVNVDSSFDLDHVIQQAKQLKVKAEVLLRLNPDIDAGVHEYLATGASGSKFGIDATQLPHILDVIQCNSDTVDLVGLHCHIGSTIVCTTVFSECIDVMVDTLKHVMGRGEAFHSIKYINLGGGLGIDYSRHAQRTTIPSTKQERAQHFRKLMNLIKDEDRICELKQKATTELEDQHHDRYLGSFDKLNELMTDSFRDNPDVLKAYQSAFPEAGLQLPMATPADLVKVIQSKMAASGLTRDLCVILEPGRSIIADTAVMLTKVIGVKNNYHKNYVVVDSAMSDLIRPSLYGSYHHIEPIQYQPPRTINSDSDSTDDSDGDDSDDNAYITCDIVGGICECADFLAKDRYIRRPREDSTLAVFDVGAYTGSMASNYNMRCRGAEVLVDGDACRIIRYPESYEHLTACYYQQ